MVPSCHVRGKDTIASEIHQLADSLFQQTHIQCPRLTMFVWGMTGEPDEAEAEMVREICEEGDCTFERIPQFLFVKRQKTLHDGRVQVYAAPVTRSRLRDGFPELDLLAYDAKEPELDLIADQIEW